MVIDDTIINAIRLMRLDNDSNNSAVARKLGLSRAHIGKILKGNVQYFEPKTWNNVEHVLKYYLNEVKRQNKACGHSICPYENQDEKDILEYYKTHITERRLLLAEIERLKNKSKGGDCPGELQADKISA